MRKRAGYLPACLAAAGGAVPFGDMMSALWPDAQVRQATDRLFTEVGNLRRTIRIAAGTSDIDPVVRTSRRYRLDPAVVDVDRSSRPTPQGDRAHRQGGRRRPLHRGNGTARHAHPCGRRNTSAVRRLHDRIVAALGEIDATMTTDSHRRADELLAD
jgi:hypothetical protein